MHGRNSEGFAALALGPETQGVSHWDNTITLVKSNNETVFPTITLWLLWEHLQRRLRIWIQNSACTWLLLQSDWQNRSNHFSLSVSAGVKCPHLKAIWCSWVHKQRASGVLPPHNMPILSWQTWSQHSDTLLMSTESSTMKYTHWLSPYKLSSSDVRTYRGETDSLLTQSRLYALDGNSAGHRDQLNLWKQRNKLFSASEEALGSLRTVTPAMSPGRVSYWTAVWEEHVGSAYLRLLCFDFS